ncbi:MAG TPA: hypothetical protein VGI46_21485 [Candidatus Acidoferrum sp.]|jgi:hypothetical protein
MRFFRVALLSRFAFSSCFTVAQQTPPPPATQSPQHDAQAVTLVQQSVAAMAGTVPTDSSASGTVTIVEGSTTQSGSIQILTLGTSQTSETITLPDNQRATVYSNGDAKEVNSTVSLITPLQLSLTEESPDFPLPILLSALGNADEAFRYVGAETLNSEPVQHIQVWNSFASQPSRSALAPFSKLDIWLDSSSGLVVKLLYTRHTGGGAAPAFPVEVQFSNYTKVNGILYPFQINKSFNGVPWQTITIQNVSFNTGLTAAQFQVQ